MRLSYSQQKGFTMVELMVTLVVAAVVLTIAIPSFQNMIRSSLLASGAENLTASLNLARAKAIMARRDVRMCPSTDGTSCASGGSWTGGWIIFVDEDGNGSPASTELFQARGAMDSRISLTPPTDFTQSIEFKPTGIVYGNGNPGKNGTFTLCSGDYHKYSRLVSISASGRVTTRKQADLCKIIEVEN
jgi:type IV fimbrial biogenesis protein FimT